MDQEAQSPLLSMQGEKNPCFFHEFPSERLLRLNKLKQFYLDSPSCSSSLVIRKMQMLHSDIKISTSHISSNRVIHKKKELINIITSCISTTIHSVAGHRFKYKLVESEV